MATLAKPDGYELRVVDGERVEAVRRSLPADELLQDAAAVFGLLGDRNRLRLLSGLRTAGELCVCDLAAAAGMSESSTSHALRLLRVHGVVGVRREGRMSYYSLRDDHVRTLLDVALEHLRHGA
ncbi:MAG: ArsR/SmtB family transcription factor [Actinomycetota bacterium]